MHTCSYIYVHAYTHIHIIVLEYKEGFERKERHSQGKERNPISRHLPRTIEAGVQDGFYFGLARHIENGLSFCLTGHLENGLARKLAAAG